MKYRVNLDFDAALAANNPNLKIDKYLTELEYIFFLVNQSAQNSLYTKLDYSSEYLDHIARLGFVVTETTNVIDNCTDWWGDLSNFEIAKTLNSKCWLASWHRPLEDEVIKNSQDRVIGSRKFYRPDQTFSGIGNKIINRVEDLGNVSFPGVLSTFVKVIKTFGITYNLSNDEYYIVENLTGPNGQFKGGRLTTLNDLDVDIDLKETIELIKSNLPNSNISKIQFDNMVYEGEDGKLKLCPLVELNYRRTMGEVIFNVTKVLGEGTLHFGDKQYLNQDSIILSPSFVKNICYYNRLK